MCLTADLYHLLAGTSKDVQSANFLPWEYKDKINHLQSMLEMFSENLQSFSNINSFVDLRNKISSLPPSIFSNFVLCVEIFDNFTFKGVPLPEMPVGANNLRSITSCKEITSFIDTIKAFVHYVICLNEKIEEYFSGETDTDILIQKTNFLFNYDYLMFPRNCISETQASTNRGFSAEEFYSYIKNPFYNISDESKLWFEYQYLDDWMCRKVNEERKGSTGYEPKTLLKKAIIELSEEIPDLIKFLRFLISVPVSEAVCESWGSIIENVSQLRMRCADGSNTEIGTVDKRVFILLNGPPSGYRKTRKFLKAALISMFGSSYSKHFTNVSAQFSKNIVSGVVSKIMNNSDCIPCFL